MSTIVADSIEPRTSGGAVTFPNRPAFAVRGYGSLQDGATVNGIAIASGTDIIYNYTSIDINRGSAFDNTRGIYTVPVAGIYQVHAGFGYKSSSNYLKLLLFLTPNDPASSGHIAGWSLNDGQHYNTQLSTIVEATVGQEFALGLADQYANPYADNSYLWFSACLVG